MTMKVVLKHDEEKLEHAYGIETDVFPQKMGQVIKDYLDSPNEKLSSLGDHIQDSLEPNEILFLASLTVIGKLDEMESDIEQMSKIAKKLGL